MSDERTETGQLKREFEYIEKCYGVRPRRGGRVRVYSGREGTITRSAGHYIRVRLDGESSAGYYHPTWRMEYLDA